MLAKPIFSDIFAAGQVIQSWFSEGLPVVVSGLPILCRATRAVTQEDLSGAR